MPRIFEYRSLSRMPKAYPHAHQRATYPHKVRKRQKLKTYADKLLAIPAWGHLACCELEESRPCGDIEDYDESAAMRRALSQDLYLKDSEESRAWERDHEEFLDNFLTNIREAPLTFPMLKSTSFSSSSTTVERIWEELADNPDDIRAFYEIDAPKAPGWPKASEIDEAWVIFRGYQVFLARKDHRSTKKGLLSVL